MECDAHSNRNGLGLDLARVHCAVTLSCTVCHIRASVYLSMKCYAELLASRALVTSQRPNGHACKFMLQCSWWRK
eukprot:5556683-Amphidinium_carterae.1